ncbi:unannotated protein [freshwater metagenome]|uniref:Unannotated protein n=1 Tax=freshwater metagenome TaxID=449393 RepID=A0A6J7C670_9ZZZZ
MVMSAAMNGFASPTTMQWLISQWARRRSSSAAGATFFPPAVTRISFLRPVIVRYPSSSSAPRSPECSQPSASRIAAVPSGSAQYPMKTCGPRRRTSPSSAILTEAPGNGRPTVPIRSALGRFTVVAPAVSVSP